MRIYELIRFEVLSGGGSQLSPLFLLKPSSL